MGGGEKAAAERSSMMMMMLKASNAAKGHSCGLSSWIRPSFPHIPKFLLSLSLECVCVCAVVRIYKAVRKRSALAGVLLNRAMR